ncbi:MAG TPA: copper homeostasis periplasmic binding protein CopC [Micropepsaceae bacterium]|nr:copper homeostasis periplasmic binding protein CopC [Micropepsaceae bacterium]
MRRFLFLTTMLCLLVMNKEAEAHAFLLKSDPTVGATVAAPQTLRLEFSEAIELAFSGIDVTNGSGGAVPARNVRLDSNDRKVLLADLPPLSAGAYRVKWHVVSVDTHRTEGDFAFSVKP